MSESFLEKFIENSETFLVHQVAAAAVHVGHRQDLGQRVHPQVQQLHRIGFCLWLISHRPPELQYFARKVIEEKCCEECLEILQLRRPMGD